MKSRAPVSFMADISEKRGDGNGDSKDATGRSKDLAANDERKCSFRRENKCRIKI